MASDSLIPAFEDTPLEDIPTQVQGLRNTFRTGRTKDIQFRLIQLRKLYWALTDNVALLEEALMADLHKSKHEAQSTEISWCQAELLDFITNLEAWARDEPNAHAPLMFKPMGLSIRHEPLGVVLVIGPFNFPIQLNISAVAGAIAAGNCVVLKPSEGSPRSAMVLKKLIDEHLDPECYICVNGGLEQSQRVLDQKFDKIAFTGGKTVGKIVAKKAAETLTPVLLELGGQNPAFVTKNANIKLAARRLLWAKVLNAGQVCLSQNYILVERSVVSQLIAELNGQYRTFMPRGAKNSPDYGRIGSKAAFVRLKKMLDSTQGSIVLGGSMDESELFIEPTIVLVNDTQDSMMVEETFGPIFSIMPFDTLDQAIDIANEVDPTPLGLYAFGTDAETKKIIDNVTSGGATINDSFMHASILSQTPAGGVGQSGTGMCHGFYSFKEFSHQRAMAHTPSWVDGLLRVRYMPYSWPHLRRLQATRKTPDFDRSGKQVKGVRYLAGLVLGLNGKSSRAALFRWVVVVLALALGQRKGYLEFLTSRFS